ncbi:MAG: hypothetical protein WCO94_05890 [Verrucomicrobiota bacterium]
MATKTDKPDMPLLRAKVREVLAFAPQRKFTEAMIMDGANRMVPVPADLAAVRLAIEWNLGSGYVDYVYNRDEDRDEWFLTPRGKAKEGIK